MAKVLMPLANGFEEIEALTVVDVLRRANMEVVLASLQPGTVTGAHQVSIIADTTLDKVNADSFDMLILPGGQPGTDTLNADPRIHDLVKRFYAEHKLIGAICAAPIILADAGLLHGKTATCYPSYSKAMDGAVYEERPVVTCDNLITSRGPGTAMSFGLEIVGRLAGSEVANSVAKAMLFMDSSQQDVWDRQLFNSTIQALVGALEMKDSYTQGRAKRVTEFSLSIGARLNLSRSEMRDLYLGAIISDIGKIGTEEELLNKPDTLSRSEEIIIREHPLKSSLFIVGIENLNHIVPTILHHHEHWDGTGYPERLKGEHIPLHARIVSIADSYDAMISNRSYRSGMKKEVAIKELIKKKGAQFDPFLVDVFIECLNDSQFGMKDFSYYF